MGWAGLMAYGLCELGWGFGVFSARGRAHEVVYCVMPSARPCVLYGLPGCSGLWLYVALRKGCQIFYFGGFGKSDGWVRGGWDRRR